MGKKPEILPNRSGDGPRAEVLLNHPTHLPVYPKVQHYLRHPLEGPPMVVLSGGSGARGLAAQLARLTHNATHVLPVFDDGGSSRELRLRLGMPPPGDLRNRLMALADTSVPAKAEVFKLFRTRLPQRAEAAELEAQLHALLDETHPQMARIEPRYRRIIIAHLERFCRDKPADFDLTGGSIGNFVIAGAYLAVRDLESVLFQLSQLAAVRGEVVPVCLEADLHLSAELEDGTRCAGQARITQGDHAPIERLAIVRRQDGRWIDVAPSINPLAARAIERSALVAYAMGSFYTSTVPLLAVAGMGRAIRETKRPKVYVANLYRDRETPGMRVSQLIAELCRYLGRSDSEPGEVSDYVHYALVNDHGNSAADGHVPVDLPAIRELGVEPIVLPLERPDGTHDAELVAAVLVSLC